MPRPRFFPVSLPGAMLLLGASILVAAAPAPAAPPATVPPADGDPLAGAAAFTLDNGLTVVLRPDATHPVVAVQMLYRVGARNETIGLTGIAHYLEHMLFRGTEHFGLADVTGVIERAGGEWHGYTTLDCTTYFEAAPKETLATLLRLEAERMVSGRMAADEVEPERGAVFQEYRGYQLDARSDLFDATTALLFQQHPYRNNTMGWESDLAGITHADLVSFYRRHYGPKNAVLAIAGDIDVAEARRAVEEIFGPIPAGGADTTIRTVEPPLEGPRRLTLLRPGAVPALQISFLAPPPSRPRDFAAWLVLDAHLGHAPGLSFYRHSGDLGTGGGAPAGSPLGRLVESGLLGEAGASLVPTLYPYHFTLYAYGFDPAKSSEAEASLFDLLAEAADEVSAADVESARRRIVAADLLETDALVEQAHELAYWTALGGVGLRAEVRRALDAVTVEEVRAAAAGLVPSHAAVGLVLPAARSAPQGGIAVPPAAERAKRPAPARPKPAAGLPAKRVARTEIATLGLGGGARAIVDARPHATTFVLHLAVHASAGTAVINEDDLTRSLVPLGVTFEVGAPAGGSFGARDTLQIEAAGPAEAFETAIELLQARGLKLARGKGGPVDPETLSRPMRRAMAYLDRAATGVGAAAGPSGASAGPFLALVGPFEPGSVKDRLASLAAPLRTAVAGRPAGAPQLQPGKDVSAIPSVPQGALVLAIPGDADAMAQEAVAWILQHNYGGRLGTLAIAKLGLVYDMDSESVRRGAPLVWFGMGADPEALARLEEALVAELARARSGLTEEELAAFKSHAAGRLAVRRADPAQAARLWLAALLRGEDDRGVAREADRAARLKLSEVTAAAERMLDPRRLRVIAVGRAPG